MGNNQKLELQRTIAIAQQYKNFLTLVLLTSRKLSLILNFALRNLQICIICIGSAGRIVMRKKCSRKFLASKVNVVKKIAMKFDMVAVIQYLQTTKLCPYFMFFFASSTQLFSVSGIEGMGMGITPVNPRGDRPGSLTLQSLEYLLSMDFPLKLFFFLLFFFFLVPHLYGRGTLVLGQDFTIKNTTLSLMNPLRSGA